MRESCRSVVGFCFARTPWLGPRTSGPTSRRAGGSPDLKLLIINRDTRPREAVLDRPQGSRDLDLRTGEPSAWGTEAQILRDGDLVIGRRFENRALALLWAEQERIG